MKVKFKNEIHFSKDEFKKLNQAYEILEDFQEKIDDLKGKDNATLSGLFDLNLKLDEFDSMMRFLELLLVNREWRVDKDF